MNKKYFIFFALVAMFSLKISAQSYTFRTSLKEMCGDPGDIFSCSFSFTNTTNAPISIFINRYQKTMPPYWYSCYCYTQCNSPLRDTLTIFIPAFSTDVVYVQFKTDSVNPGTSTSDFTLNQVGFQNDMDSIHLDASTACNLATGINELNGTNNVTLFPNPATTNLTVSISNLVINEIKVYNIVGQLKEKVKPTNSGSQTLNLKDYEQGVYFIEVYTDKTHFIERFIKE